MLAARYLGDRRFDFPDLESAAPAAGEVQVAVAYTGICGTDLHIFQGDMDSRVRPPQVIGHEMVGRVAALGPGVEGVAPGDLVTVRPLRPCGSCSACRAGFDHVCRDQVVLGVDAPGSLQQLWNVPAGIVIGLPAGLDEKAAALTEPTAVAVHDVKRSSLVAGERALVVGGGPIGLLIAVVARARGGEVALVEPHPGRRSLAASLGFAAVDPGVEDLDAFVADWTSGEGAEVSFEVSGAAAGVESAVGALAPRGRLCLVAIHAEQRRVDLLRIFLRELTLVGARLYERDDFDTAAGLLADGTVPASAFVSAVLPMTETESAFSLLHRGDAMKVLVDCAGSAI